MVAATAASALTARERYQRCFERRDLDRCPVWDTPWGATLARWHREGLPKDVGYWDFFGLDRIAGFGVDNSPRWPSETIEETPEYRIHRTPWGATLKDWKEHGGVPEFLDFRINSPEAWAEAKARIAPSDERIPWAQLKRDWPQWQADGAWIEAGLWFGFDVTHSWMVGTERVLNAIVEQPEWLVDMWNTQVDTQLALLDQVWAKGYRFDAVRWPDDMGFKGKQFFSRKTYQRLLKPVHKKAVDWAHAHGIRAVLHSCGDIRPLVADLVDIGIDMLNPIEVKAGMDPAALKREHGAKLAFHGGLNAALFGRMDEFLGEVDRIVPILMQGGGYVVASDHSVPDSVSVEDFRRFVDHAKRVATY